MQISVLDVATQQLFLHFNLPVALYAHCWLVNLKQPYRPQITTPQLYGNLDRRAPQAVATEAPLLLLLRLSTNNLFLYP